MNTTCRCGTGARSFSLSHSAHRTCFFLSHDAIARRNSHGNEEDSDDKGEFLHESSFHFFDCSAPHLA